MLLRVLKRRTSLELDDAALVLDLEFSARDGKPDLALSVYRAQNNQEALQLYCEHAVGCVSPPGGRGAFDLDGVAGPVERAVPGASLFALARERHRELVFDDGDDVRQFVARVVESRSKRSVRFESSTAYARIRELRKDDAWEAAFQQSPNRDRWSAKV